LLSSTENMSGKMGAVSTVSQLDTDTKDSWYTMGGSVSQTVLS